MLRKKAHTPRGTQAVQTALDTSQNKTKTEDRKLGGSKMVKSGRR